MQIEFQNSINDFREAKSGEPIFRRVNHGVFVITATATAFYMLYKGQAFSQHKVVSTPLRDQVHALVPGLIICVAVMAVALFIQKLAYKRAWAGHPNAHFRERWDISECGIVIDTEHARSEVDWSVFLRSREQATLFVLYTSKYAYVMVPKRAFSDLSQQAEFAELLRRHIPSAINALRAIAPEETKQTQ